MSIVLAQATSDGGHATPAAGHNVEVPLPSQHAQVDVPLHGGSGSESLFPPFDVNAFPSHLFWLAIAFGILFFFVNRLVVPKVGGIIEDRRDRIASDLGEASRLARETDEVIAAYESELATARHNAYAIAQERREAIKAEQARQQAETEATLAARIAEAETEIAARRDAALADVTTIAVEATQEIVGLLSKAPASAKEAEAAVKKAEAKNV
ncbi:F0F1 ATP synthase subunit B [Acuticoccus mangrovi]|uniref:ATP synthase subunit b n=1 Tax=Acuticoccus mangrovi TaxID=2796142 RepID=A0A934MJ62_9HYPH|nr:F0F1 ATP synthase subunit B [Acuticoccus mangrovi]MBJ3774269.1 F0F1 ATP synthase subunit B [Acuticoccus mangrovi]